MKALLTQHKCESALLATKPTGVADTTWDEMLKSAHSALILCLGDRVSREVNKETTTAAAIDTAISDEDQALLLLTSLPSSYGNFVETLLYGLCVRGRSNQRDMKLGGGGAQSKSRGRCSKPRCYICNSDEHLKMDCLKRNLKILSRIKIRYQVLELMGNVVYGGRVRLRDGSSFVLDNVRYVPELRRNLISLGRTRKANYVYTLAGQAVTRKTFKGRKQLGEFETEWKIKTGNVLDSCNQRSTQQCMKSGVTKYLGVAGIQLQNGLVEETNVTLLAKGAGLQEVQTQDLIASQFARDREQHSTRKIFRYSEENNEAAFAVAEAKKIYAHELFTFNHTVACDVFSKRKTGLKE
nr:zinc finger, CCHC-type [Tanacetum cinerariifolium]